MTIKTNKAMKNPKEEQKQHLIDMMKADEELGLYKEPKTGYIKSETKLIGIEFTFADGSKQFIPKQETTPEEVAEYLGFVKGAKWKIERLCDSEVIQRIRASKSDAEARRIIRTI